LLLAESRLCHAVEDHNTMEDDFMDVSTLTFGEERSPLALRIRSFAASLAVDGVNAVQVIRGVEQALLDLYLDDDGLKVDYKIRLMRECGNTLLAMVDALEDRIDAIERSRAAGLPDSARN
jgi:hypothetical protein